MVNKWDLIEKDQNTADKFKKKIEERKIHKAEVKSQKAEDRRQKSEDR